MDWKYICIDLKQGFEDWDAGHSGIKVWEVELYREPYNDIWVDEVVIAGAPTTENWDGKNFSYVSIISTMCEINLF